MIEHNQNNTKSINTSEEFISTLGELYQENLEISRKKNHDYGGERNPFANFMLAEQFGIPAEKALLVRMSDKMSRIATALTSELQVSDESVADTCKDLANYSMILLMYLENKKTMLK